jgi:thiamine-monophosphate kinase
VRQARASGVVLELDTAALPLSPETVAVARVLGVSPAELAATGGEDYELCFTAALGAVEPHCRAFEEAFQVRLTCVGRMGGGDGVWWTDAEGHRTPLGLGGYQHFEAG